jgi:hypothetical protein
MYRYIYSFEVTILASSARTVQFYDSELFWLHMIAYLNCIL